MARCQQHHPASVHPRRRGEHADRVDACKRGDGSSPQARGTPELYLRSVLNLRFIPAGAGNTLQQYLHHRPAAVHPRRRGEHWHGSGSTQNGNGSSPQARGTHVDDERGVIYDRFIPAGAGNTGQLIGMRDNPTVHPRRRGEHMTDLTTALREAGSSPQARGTHQHDQPLQRWHRFIPAGAGNTPP